MIALANELQKAVEFYNETNEDSELCYYHVIDSLSDPSDEKEVQATINFIYEVSYKNQFVK